MRRALVTGGNRGIGKAIAAGLRDAGLEVVIAARTASEGAAAADELGVLSVAMDLQDARTITAGLEAAGEIDVLVNNAGVQKDTPLFGENSDFFEAMDVMVMAPFMLIREVVQGMGARGYGRIVNLSSGWGSFGEGLGGPGAYGVAKAALNALTLAGSRHVPAGVKINAMCPGWVRTRMGGPGASLSPEEGADTAIWLATLPEDGPSGGFFRRRKPIAW